MLSAAAYDGSKQLLYLRFRNTGDVYRYFDFPAADIRPSWELNRRVAFSALNPRSLPLRAHGQTPRRLISSQRFAPAPPTSVVKTF
jgi:hypothetical protein